MCQQVWLLIVTPMIDCSIFYLSIWCHGPRLDNYSQHKECDRQLLKSHSINSTTFFIHSSHILPSLCGVDVVTKCGFLDHCNIITTYSSCACRHMSIIYMTKPVKVDHLSTKNCQFLSYLLQCCFSNAIYFQFQFQFQLTKTTLICFIIT